MIVHKKDVISLMMAQMRVSKYTVYEHMRRPDFPQPVRVVGTYKAYELESVADWLAMSATQAQQILLETREHAVS